MTLISPTQTKSAYGSLKATGEMNKYINYYHYYFSFTKMWEKNFHLSVQAVIVVEDNLRNPWKSWIILSLYCVLYFLLYSSTWYKESSSQQQNKCRFWVLQQIPQSSSSKTNNCWRNSNWEMHTSCGLLLLLTDNVFIAVGTCGCHKTPKHTWTRLTAHQHAAAQLLRQIVETVTTK